MTRDEIIGTNVTRLRGKTSMDKVVEAMRDKGNAWSKTTLFNVEHGKRPLRLPEASDLLRCLGYDPIVDLPKLLNTPAAADIQIAVTKIPEMYEQLIVDFDALSQSRQKLADDAQSLATQSKLNRQLSRQVEEVLKDSQLCNLLKAFISANDRDATQSDNNSKFHEWLQSGLDEEETSPTYIHSSFEETNGRFGAEYSNAETFGLNDGFGNGEDMDF